MSRTLSALGIRAKEMDGRSDNVAVNMFIFYGTSAAKLTTSFGKVVPKKIELEF